MQEQNEQVAEGSLRMAQHNEASQHVIAGLQQKSEQLVERIALYESREQQVVCVPSVVSTSSSATTGNAAGASVTSLQEVAGTPQEATTTMPNSPDRQPLRSQNDDDDHFNDINHMRDGFYLVSPDTK